MIKSNDADVIHYDIESQLAVLEQIKHTVKDLIPCMADYGEPGEAQTEIEKFKYFVREYCRTDDIPAGFDEQKALHGALCDEIEAFEL